MAKIKSINTKEIIVELDPDEVQEALCEYAKRVVAEGEPDPDDDSLKNGCADIHFSEKFGAYEADVTFTVREEKTDERDRT